MKSAAMIRKVTAALVLLTTYITSSGTLAADEESRAQTAPTRPARLSRLGRGRVDVYRDINYVPGSSNWRQTLDLYVPKQAGSGPFPLVVWIHGGAWRGGDKRGGPFFPLLASGFAVASINYRLTDEAQFPAQIYDCKAAVRFLRAHAHEYNLQSDRIGVWGASAGGHLAALLGTSGGVQSLEGHEGNLQCSSRVQAVCDWFGASDLLTAKEQVSAIKGDQTALMAIPHFIGGTVQEQPERAKQASPITYVSKDNPPFLIMHGDRDHMVPPAQSIELRDAMQAKGAPVTLQIIPGARHGGFGFGVKPRLAVIDFFENTIKKAPSSTGCAGPKAHRHGAAMRNG